jgi:hypothetical protein
VLAGIGLWALRPFLPATGFARQSIAEPGGQARNP